MTPQEFNDKYFGTNPTGVAFKDAFEITNYDGNSYPIHNMAVTDECAADFLGILPAKYKAQPTLGRPVMGGNTWIGVRFTPPLVPWVKVSGTNAGGASVTTCLNIADEVYYFAHGYPVAYVMDGVYSDFDYLLSVAVP